MLDLGFCPSQCDMKPRMTKLHTLPRQALKVSSNEEMGLSYVCRPDYVSRTAPRPRAISLPIDI